MLGLKVPIRHAQDAKEFLKARGLLVPGFSSHRAKEYFYLPVSAKFPQPPFPASFCQTDFEQVGKKSFTELLAERRVLNSSEVGHLVSSFDVVGDIAVIEIPPELKPKEKLIASCLLDSQSPHVKVVAKRAGITAGRFRVRKVKVLAGEKRTLTIHRENGVSLEIDLNKAYFSSRLGFERSRISSLVKPGENVLVLFAGVGPFAIEIAKAQKSAHVIAVELNPEAVKLAKRNVALNRVPNVKVVLADAAKFLKKKEYFEWADRTIMPLPKTAKAFLPAAVNATKKGGVVHYYSIASELEENVFGEAEKDAAAACAKVKRKYEFISARKAKPYAPLVTQVVLDFQAN